MGTSHHVSYDTRHVVYTIGFKLWISHDELVQLTSLVPFYFRYSAIVANITFLLAGEWGLESPPVASVVSCIIVLLYISETIMKDTSREKFWRSFDRVLDHDSCAV